ncbi:MAG: hypothetical protein H8E44_20320 [Planctomycetes bacterium]|nr:hypothetical protein [Planctomycetota bacterium]MBL7038608.1 hypothetical protein [Pirellulaceae bacterium]
MMQPSRFSIRVVASMLIAATAIVCGPSVVMAQSDDGSQSAEQTRPTSDHDGGAQTRDLPSNTADARESSEEAQHKQSTDSNAAEITRAIQDLASAKFRDRQAAHRQLAAAGNLAVDALEKAAKSDQSEIAMRCVEILAQIARDEKGAGAALAALERLSTDPAIRVADHAAIAFTALTTTDEERAIAALTAEGARILRNRDGSVRSVSNITRDAQVAHLKHFPQLQSVHMSGREVTDAGLAYLAELKQISDLTFYGSSVTGVGLGKLSGLTSLESLRLASQKFANEDLRQLRHVPKLRSLSLLSSIDESELQFLTDMSQIKSLRLSDVRLSQQGVDIINQLDNLRGFSLSISDGNDGQLRWLGQLKVPLSLNVMRSPEITNAGWKHLEGALLVSLDLMHTPITDIGLAHVGRAKTLASLAIIKAPVSDAGLVHLQELKALEVLTLRDTKVTDDGVARLRRSLPNLSHVQIGANARPPRMRTQKPIGFKVNPETGGKSAHLRTRLTAQNVKQLRQEPNLDTIFLTHGETKDDDLLLLVGVPMKGLVIDSKHVTDRGVKALGDHPALESLSLWSSSITDGSLKSIARIPSLTKLTIHEAPITDEGVSELVARLADLGKLKSLHFFRCPRITNDGLNQIGRLTSLERLFLNNNDGLTSGLLTEIAHLKNLHRLELDSIALDEADLVHLAALTKLETLGLSCSNSESKLTDHGLTYVGRIPTLRSLTIQDARITDKGVSDLIKLNALQTLGLARTGITDQGIAAIASELPNLVQLGISGTKVTDAGMAHVGKLTRLEWLWLDGTAVGDEGIGQLDRLTRLQYVYLDASRVSNEGHQQFRLAHPATRIRLQ